MALEFGTGIWAFGQFVDRYAADGRRTARGWAAGLAPGDMEGIDFSDRQAARAAIAAKLAAAAE